MAHLDANEILRLISRGEPGKNCHVVFIKIATPFKKISKENTNLPKVMVVWNFI